MNSTSDFTSSGGFIHPAQPPPAPSPANPTSHARTILPQPRPTPLKPGTSRESSFIDYVDRQLLAISRRYEKRLNVSFEDVSSSETEGREYQHFEEMANDLDAVIDVVWVSGTRTEPSSKFMFALAKRRLQASGPTNTVLPDHCTHDMYFPSLLPICTPMYLQITPQA